MEKKQREAEPPAMPGGRWFRGKQDEEQGKRDKKMSEPRFPERNEHCKWKRKKRKGEREGRGREKRKGP